MINAKNSLIIGASTARSIGVRTQNVRGRIAHRQEYESLLERDFFTLLRVDISVESFITQPIEIPYELGGVRRVYFPDVLVKYRPDSQGAVRRTTLFEVKPEEYADHPDDELAAKLAAANLFCPSMGWDFKVVSEPDIYTPRLKNANFLLRFIERKCDPVHKKLLLEQLRAWNGCATPKALLAGVFRSTESQAGLLPDLWTMVAQGTVLTDLDAPLTMNSEIWEKAA
ncbi:MAG: TnsA endonuclease N-terminal domain-containing protein [Pseudomonadota bacterium]